MTRDTPALQDWIVVAICFIALAFTFGARSSVSMVLPFWHSEMGWTGAQSATGASIVLVMMAIGSPIAGNIMDRYGARVVFAGGLIALSIGIGTTSLASDPWHYYVMFGLIGGMGWAAVSIPLVIAAVSRLFTNMRGLAAGIATAGASGGQLPVLSGLGLMVAVYGWRNSYLVLSAALALMVVLIVVCFREPDISGDSDASGPGAGADTLSDRVMFLFRNRTFLLLLAAFTLCGFTTAGVIDVYFIPYAITCGFTLIEGSTAYGIHGVGNLAGVVLFSWLADHVHRPLLLAGMFFMRALAFVLLIFVGSDIGLLFAFAAFFGFLNFATFPVIANIVATHIGVRIIGLTLGLLFGGHSLGAAVGVATGGWMFDLMARYEWVWWLSTALAALAGLFAILVRESRGPLTGLRSVRLQFSR